MLHVREKHPKEQKDQDVMWGDILSGRKRAMLPGSPRRYGPQLDRFELQKSNYHHDELLLHATNLRTMSCSVLLSKTSLG